MTQIAKLTATIAANAADQAVAHGLDRAPDLVFIVEKVESALKNMLKILSLSDVGAAIGTTKAKVKTAAAADYLVDGVFYTLAISDDFWTLTDFDCTNAMYNKCLLCIDDQAAMQIGAGTEAATAAGVVLPAPPADSAVVGVLQVNPTGTGNFVGGTTDLDDGTVIPNATFSDVAFHPDMFPEITLGAAADATSVYVDNSMAVARDVYIIAMALHSIIE